MAINDVTGDPIKSKPLSKQGRENWDKIFGNEKKKNSSQKEEKEKNNNEKNLGNDSE